MDQTDYTDVFRKACLIQLSTSVWQGCCKLDRNVLERVGNNSNWLKGSKDLVNKDLLAPVRKIASQARNEIRKHALPFPINSVYLVSKESLAGVDAKLQEQKAQFWEKVHDFELLFEMAKEEARDYLGELYNEADYPMDILRKFHFDWRFLVLEVPGRSSILPPEIYEREKEKFQTLMQETRDLAINALREEFSQIVHRLAEKLDKDGAQPQVIKRSMFSRLKDFLDDFGDRNIFEDDVLVELAQQARGLIDGVSPAGIKKNDVMRKRIKKEMNDLRSSIDAAMEDMPRRKIRMAG